MAQRDKQTPSQPRARQALRHQQRGPQHGGRVSLQGRGSTSFKKSSRHRPGHLKGGVEPRDRRSQKKLRRKASGTFFLEGLCFQKRRLRRALHQTDLAHQNGYADMLVRKRFLAWVVDCVSLSSVVAGRCFCSLFLQLSSIAN